MKTKAENNSSENTGSESNSTSESVQILVKPSSRFIFTTIFINSISYTLLLFIILFSSQLYNDSQKLIRDVLSNKPNDYNLPTFADLLPSLAYLPILIVINKLFFFAFQDYISKNLSSSILEENSSELNEIYIHKTCTCIFKFFFYTFSTLLGYFTLSETDFLPTNLFGKGMFINIWKKDFPEFLYWNRPESLYFYININLTFSIFDLYELLMNPLQTDFLFMIVHHFSTISLIVFSFVTNYSHVGSSIIFLHFYGDIFSYIVKSILYLNVQDYLKGITTFLFLINFSYSRIYVFFGWLIDVQRGIRHSWYLFETWLYNFLCILFLLHLVWTFMIGKKFIQYIVTGKVVDITKVKKKKENKIN